MIEAHHRLRGGILRRHHPTVERRLRTRTRPTAELLRELAVVTRLRARAQRRPLDPTPRPARRVRALPRQTPPHRVLQHRRPSRHPRPTNLAPTPTLPRLGRRVHRSPHPHPNTPRLRLNPARHPLTRRTTSPRTNPSFNAPRNNPARTEARPDHTRPSNPGAQPESPTSAAISGFRGWYRRAPCAGPRPTSLPAPSSGTSSHRSARAPLS